jgi:hypothetical protein
MTASDAEHRLVPNLAGTKENLQPHLFGICACAVSLYNARSTVIVFQPLLVTRVALQVAASVSAWASISQTVTRCKAM